MPFKYTFPSLELFGQTCDAKATGTTYNDSSLGIYCCRPCKLWRLVTERCGQLYTTKGGHDQSCFLENPTEQKSLPYLRAQSSLDNSDAAPHWLFIPPVPNRGIEDPRTNASLFQQAWRMALEPATYLAPIAERSFDSSVIPDKMGLTNVGIGINMADLRSQHQAHIHYAALPVSFRNHLLQQANNTISKPTCTVATGLRFGNEDVTYYWWFFQFDLAQPPAGFGWNLRELALQDCAPLLDTLTKDPQGKLMTQPPGLPFGPALGPVQGDDFLMGQIAVIVAPAFALDPATQRPQGHYVLMGSTPTHFHAESLLCTEYGIQIGWDAEKDCPPTAAGWPKPLASTSTAKTQGGVRQRLKEVMVNYRGQQQQEGQQAASFGARRWAGTMRWGGRD